MPYILPVPNITLGNRPASRRFPSHSQYAANLLFVYLAAARQARIASRACPDLASAHRARARYWLAMARRAPSPTLP